MDLTLPPWKKRDSFHVEPHQRHIDATNKLVNLSTSDGTEVHDLGSGKGLVPANSRDPNELFPVLTSSGITGVGGYYNGRLGQGTYTPGGTSHTLVSLTQSNLGNVSVGGISFSASNDIVVRNFNEIDGDGGRTHLGHSLLNEGQGFIEWGKFAGYTTETPPRKVYDIFRNARSALLVKVTAQLGYGKYSGRICRRASAMVASSGNLTAAELDSGGFRDCLILSLLEVGNTSGTKGIDPAGRQVFFIGALWEYASDGTPIVLIDQVQDDPCP